MAFYRLGILPYLNARPLTFHLEQCPRPDVVLTTGVPSALIEQLQRGELDAALVSSFACLADARLVILPGSGIVSRGPVDSIRLFCAVDPPRLRRVALDRSSRSGAALARILLAECFGVHPEYQEHPPDLASMLSVAEGALLIGDPALRAFHSRPWPRQDLVALDLGQMWHELTSLPFVYAVWAARRDADTAGLAALVAQARAVERTHLAAIADAAAPRIGVPAAVCRRYLCDLLQFELGDDEWEGLQRFRTLAIRHALVPADTPPLTMERIA